LFIVTVLAWLWRSMASGLTAGMWLVPQSL
jgi:hypothetical protein